MVWGKGMQHVLDLQGCFYSTSFQPPFSRTFPEEAGTDTVDEGKAQVRLRPHYPPPLSSSDLAAATRRPLRGGRPHPPSTWLSKALTFTSRSPCLQRQPHPQARAHAPTWIKGGRKSRRVAVPKRSFVCMICCVHVFLLRLANAISRGPSTKDDCNLRCSSSKIDLQIKCYDFYRIYSQGTVKERKPFQNPTKNMYT